MTVRIFARPIRHTKKNTGDVLSHNKLHDDNDAMKTEPVVHDAVLETWWWYDDERQKFIASREDHDVFHRSHHIKMTVDQDLWFVLEALSATLELETTGKTTQPSISVFVHCRGTLTSAAFNGGCSVASLQVTRLCEVERESHS